MIMKSKHRWALSLVDNTKTYIEKAYPKDKKLIGLLNEALHIVAWKVHEDENKSNGPGHKKS
jgi:hypothetical protein